MSYSVSISGHTDVGTEQRLLEDLILTVEKHLVAANITNATASTQHHGQVDLTVALVTVIEAPPAENVVIDIDGQEQTTPTPDPVIVTDVPAPEATPDPNGPVSTPENVVVQENADSAAPVETGSADAAPVEGAAQASPAPIDGVPTATSAELPPEATAEGATPVEAETPGPSTPEPVPALPLYTFDGDPTATIDANVWPTATERTIDGRALFHFVSDTPGGPALGDHADGPWHVYTGELAPTA